MFIKNGSYKKHTHIISYVPPTIITQPVGGTKNVGSSHKFTISAKGSRPLTYQWFKNGFIISGETSKELNLTNLQLTDDADYYCEVRNNGYLITSNTVKLNVLIDISFVTQPTSVQVNPNSNVSFTASAVGTPPISYKWYKNSVIYPGTTHTIFINNVTKNEEGSYFAVASNLLTSITSNTATLSVNQGILIVDQPDNTSLNVGNNLTLSLSCVGTFPISAQWRKDNTNYGSLSVTNTGDVKLQISNVQYVDEGDYDCVLSNAVGSVTSNKAIFYINRPPVFTLNPVSGNGIIGGSFTFTSNATGTNPIAYQWIKEDSGNINGATLKNYTLSNLTFSNSGNYACVASNLYETVTSTFASLKTGIAPTINIHPGGQNTIAGNNVTLSVGAAGTAPLSYQWYRNDAIVTGATNPQYSFQASNATTGTYKCVVTNSFGTVTSNNAVVTIGIVPTITTHPVSQTISNGSLVTLFVVAAGTATLSYQWYINNTIITGATKARYEINSFSNANAGTYKCVVTNSFGTVTSNNATLALLSFLNRKWWSVAMSSDGTKQTAVVYDGQIYTSNDSGNTWTAKESNRTWYSVAMSSDGTKQTAVADNSQIYISTDSGNTWTPKDSARSWRSVAMSSDGTKQIAVGGNIYVSTDYGNTWTDNGTVVDFPSFDDVAMSSDGTKQTALYPFSSKILISSDSGNTRTPIETNRNDYTNSSWESVAMSSDGSIQTAVTERSLHVSTDFGNTWTFKKYDNFYDVAMSSDGIKQTAVGSKLIYTSSNSGNTWNFTGTLNGSDVKSIAMSSDGTKQTAVAYLGQIYISTDSGNTWEAKF